MIRRSLAKAELVGYNGNMEQPVKPAISNVAPGTFLREVIAELKKVTWPTREETVKLTVVVIVISILVGAFIGGLLLSTIPIAKIQDVKDKVSGFSYGIFVPIFFAFRQGFRGNVGKMV